jgi:hypothetical protein
MEWLNGLRCGHKMLDFSHLKKISVYFPWTFEVLAQFTINDYQFKFSLKTAIVDTGCLLIPLAALKNSLTNKIRFTVLLLAFFVEVVYY